MTTFDDVINKAKSVASVAGKKTCDFFEVSKLKIEAAEMEKEMSTLLEGLGRLVYDARKHGESVDILVEECIAKVDEKQVQIAELRTKIDEHQMTIRCKACDTPNADDAMYCKRCGTKLV